MTHAIHRVTRFSIVGPYVTVSGNLGDDMPKGTLASVRRQAGLKELK
jgi:predicted RNA binding protein YcfA (HicA-like mRNA interferase family)